MCVCVWFTKKYRHTKISTKPSLVWFDTYVYAQRTCVHVCLRIFLSFSFTRIHSVIKSSYHVLYSMVAQYMRVSELVSGKCVCLRRNKNAKSVGHPCILTRCESKTCRHAENMFQIIDEFP